MKSDGEWGSTIPGNEDCIREEKEKRERARKEACEDEDLKSPTHPYHHLRTSLYKCSEIE